MLGLGLGCHAAEVVEVVELGGVAGDPVVEVLRDGEEVIALVIVDRHEARFGVCSALFTLFLSLQRWLRVLFGHFFTWCFKCSRFASLAGTLLYLEDTNETTRLGQTIKAPAKEACSKKSITCLLIFIFL